MDPNIRQSLLYKLPRCLIFLFEAVLPGGADFAESFHQPGGM